MAESAYNNAKNTSMGHILFKLNYGYHPKMSFKNKADSYPKSCFTNELAKKLRKLIEIC